MPCGGHGGKASRSAQAAQLVKAGTHTQAQAAREVGISEPAVHKELTKKVKSKRVKTRLPRVAIADDLAKPPLRQPHALSMPSPIVS